MALTRGGSVYEEEDGVVLESSIDNRGGESTAFPKKVLVERRISHSRRSKEQARRWLEQEQAKGADHYRRVLLLGNDSGTMTLGELVQEERWDEALAIIYRITYW